MDLVPGMRFRNFSTMTAVALMLLGLCGGIASSQTARSYVNGPEAEFHMARMVYRSFGGAGSRGSRQPWWAIDYPMAEEHFLPALRRLTGISVAGDSRHLQVTDEEIFQYPFLFMQQPGQGNWQPNQREAERLREYLLRGGFLLVDDFHGDYDWYIFQSAMRQVLPDREILEIPDDDVLMQVFYDLQNRTQIPGQRHLAYSRGGEIVAYMQGPPHWRGIYDDHGRLMVAISFNIDMGDAWEHADDPYYPVPMTGLAYQLGVNYVIYAMTH